MERKRLLPSEYYFLASAGKKMKTDEMIMMDEWAQNANEIRAKMFEFIYWWGDYVREHPIMPTGITDPVGAMLYTMREWAHEIDPMRIDFDALCFPLRYPRTMAHVDWSPTIEEEPF